MRFKIWTATATSVSRRSSLRNRNAWGVDGVDAPRRPLCAKVEAVIYHLKEASVAEVNTIGLDIAQPGFQAHGSDALGTVMFRKKIVRAKVIAFFASQPRC